MYYVYIVIHDNASAQANRVIGQPYALEDGASIRLLSRLLITRAQGHLDRPLGDGWRTALD